MNVLPLVTRELAAASRRGRTYHARFWAASGLSSIIVWVFLTSRFPTAAVGKGLFEVCAALACGFCALAGCYTADSISREKREGTLGLLFLSGLDGADIVLGKLISGSIEAVMVVLAVSPLLALPVLVGGVTGEEVWRLIPLLLSTAACSLALGLFISVRGMREEQVLAATLAWMLFLFGGLPFLWMVQRKLVHAPSLDALLYPSPFYALKLLGAAQSLEYRRSLLVILGIGLAMLIGTTSSILRRTTETLGPRRNPNKQGEDPLKYRGVGAMRRRYQASVNAWSVLIKDGTTIRFAAGILSAGIALEVLVLGVILAGGLRKSGQGASAMIALGLTVGVKAVIACHAVTVLNRTKRSGALEMLLVTPLSPESFLAIQVERIKRLWTGPVLGLVLLGVCVSAYNGAPALYSRAAFLAIPDCFALAYVGMWMALRSKSIAGAIAGTLVRVLLPSWLAWGIFFSIAMITTTGSMGSDLFFHLWFVVVVLYDYCLVHWFKHRLGRDFRAAAADDLRQAALRRRALLRC